MWLHRLEATIIHSWCRLIERHNRLDLNHGTSLMFSLQTEGFASLARNVCHGPHRHGTFDFKSEMTTISSHFQV